MSWVAVGVAGTQLISGFFAAENTKETARLNREIADMNAEFAELDAYNTKVEGYSEVARYQKVIDSTLAEQQANLSAADVDVNYGTAATIQSETSFIGELNKMEMRKQAEESALGYKNQARMYRISGAMGYSQGIMQAESTQFNAVLGAAKTGLSGYGKNG